MTRQIQTTLLTVLFIFGLLTGLQAQEKDVYEFAGVVYNQVVGMKSYKLCFNTKDKYDCSDGSLEEGTVFSNITIPLEKLGTLSKEGWEVYAVDGVGNARTWHLRRKVN